MAVFFSRQIPSAAVRHFSADHLESPYFRPRGRLKFRRAALYECLQFFTPIAPAVISSSKNNTSRRFVASSIIVIRQQDGLRPSNYL
jgi:predicted NAD/FAD-binding protein